MFLVCVFFSQMKWLDLVFCFVLFLALVLLLLHVETVVKSLCCNEKYAYLNFNFKNRQINSTNLVKFVGKK